MKKMGKIAVRGFIARLYSATVPTVSIYGKNTLKYIFFISILIHQRHVYMNFS